jgi:hypothetical protein
MLTGCLFQLKSGAPRLPQAYIPRFDIEQPEIVRPAIAADRDRVTAAIVGEYTRMPRTRKLRVLPRGQ